MNDQIFDRSGRRPSTAIYAIVLIPQSQVTRLYYFADRNLRDRIISPIAIYAIVLFRRSRFT